MTISAMRFKFLEHTADVGIEAYGKNMEEIFENSALGMFEVMTNTKNVSPKVKRSVKIESEDIKSLLYDFLEKLLILRDSEDLIFSKFKVNKIDKGKKYSLKAEVWGEKFSPKKHEDRTVVKAITYHRMEISDKKAYFIVDI